MRNAGRTKEDQAVLFLSLGFAPAQSDHTTHVASADRVRQRPHGRTNRIGRSLVACYRSTEPGTSRRASARIINDSKNKRAISVLTDAELRALVGLMPLLAWLAALRLRLLLGQQGAETAEMTC